MLVQHPLFWLLLRPSYKICITWGIFKNNFAKSLILPLKNKNIKLLTHTNFTVTNKGPFFKKLISMIFQKWSTPKECNFSHPNLRPRPIFDCFYIRPIKCINSKLLKKNFANSLIPRTSIKNTRPKNNKQRAA